MAIPTNHYYTADAKAACCSDGGGRKWTISDTSGALDSLTSGGLVIVGQLVGIALTDYDTDQDSVVIDVDCCYELEVTAKDDAGSNQAIAVGDWLIYSASDDDVRAWDGDLCTDGDVIIGRAMEALATGTTDEICVRILQVPTFTS